MKKVLFVLDDLGGGGAERVFVNIANGFAANKIEVEFLVGIKKGVYINLLNRSIPLMEVGGTSLKHYLKAFPKIFREKKYTHIFTASHYISTAAIVVKKLTKVPAQIYLTHHYAHPQARGLKHLKGDTILRLIHFLFTPAADKIIAVSKGSLQWLRKFSYHRLRQGSHIYNPVFDETIFALAAEAVAFPVSVNDMMVLLSVGRLAEQKDHLTLIKAFQIFKQTHGNAVLFILGTGPLQSMLQNYIQQQQLTGSVFLIGFEANPYKWMARCDVFVLSSIFEGFGNVLVEAMALGKTVVSTDCPSGPAEILNNGQLGYLCPVGNPAALSDAIAKAIASPIDKELVQQSSRQYTIEAIVKKYIDIL